MRNNFAKIKMKNFKNTTIIKAGNHVQMLYDEKTDKQYMGFLDLDKLEVVLLEISDNTLVKIADMLRGIF